MGKNEMVYQKFVEVGRVAVIAGEGKIAAIVDVIDQNRALIEGPGIPRTQIRLKELHLTKLKIENLNHSAKSKIVLKAWEDAEATKKFEQSGWASGSRRPPSAPTSLTSKSSRSTNSRSSGGDWSVLRSTRQQRSKVTQECHLFLSAN